jgi:hypothetical protein
MESLGWVSSCGGNGVGEPKKCILSERLYNKKCILSERRSSQSVGSVFIGAIRAIVRSLDLLALGLSFGHELEGVALPRVNRHVNLQMTSNASLVSVDTVILGPHAFDGKIFLVLLVVQQATGVEGNDDFAAQSEGVDGTDIFGRLDGDCFLHSTRRRNVREVKEFLASVEFEVKRCEVGNLGRKGIDRLRQFHGVLIRGGSQILVALKGNHEGFDLAVDFDLARLGRVNHSKKMVTLRS